MGGPRSRVATRLPNGVTLVVEENHAAPVVAIQVWVAGGAAADPPGHGRGRAPVRARAAGGDRSDARAATAGREIDAVGGTLGAWTGLDETVFHATVAAPFVDLGVDVLGDALTGPTFAPAAVDEAKRAALAELARQAADPAQQAADRVRSALFGDGAYARPVLGTPSRPFRRSRAKRWRPGSRSVTWARR